MNHLRFNYNSKANAKHLKASKTHVKYIIVTQIFGGFVCAIYVRYPTADTHTHIHILEHVEQKPKKGFAFLKIENECKKQERDESRFSNRNTYFKNFQQKHIERERERSKD